MHLSDARRDSLHDIIAQSGIRWHGVKLNKPDWSDNSHAIAMESKKLTSDHVSYVVFNAYWEDLLFELPKSPTGKWQRIVDTSLDANNDIHVVGDKKHFVNKDYLVKARSIVILIG